LLFDLRINLRGARDLKIRWMPFPKTKFKRFTSTEVLLALVQIFVCFLTTTFMKFTSETSNYISIQRKRTPQLWTLRSYANVIIMSSHYYVCTSSIFIKRVKIFIIISIPRIFFFLLFTLF